MAYVKFINKKVQETLKARERALGWETNNETPNESIINNAALRPKDIMSRTVFVRMCSNKADDKNNILIKGGEIDKNGEIQFGVRLGNKGAYKGTVDSGFRPVAGIKDIEVSYTGGYKAIREATVNWVVNSIDDLDRLTPHFLTTGKTVILDWGWVSPTKSVQENFESKLFIKENGIDGVNVEQAIFTNPQEIIHNIGGDYDAIGGTVRNFTYNLRQDGGFDCTTTITAIGANVFEIPLDVDGGGIDIVRASPPSENPVTHAQAEGQDNIVAAGEGISDDKKASLHVGYDNIINTLINLRDIILYSQFTFFHIPDSAFKDNKVFGDNYTNVTRQSIEVDLPFQHWNNVHTDKAVQKYEGKIKGNWKRVFDKTTTKLYETKPGVQRKSSRGGAKAKVGAWTNSSKTLLMMIVDRKMNLMVKWAWFEDQLLNRYTSFVGGKDNDLKMTLRSIDTLLSVDPKTQGQPISTEGKTAEQLKDAFPEQNIPPLQKFNKVLKTPTQIRYNKLMLANNPFKSFILENLPSANRVANHNGDSLEIGKLFERLKGGGNQVSFKDPNDETKGFLRNIWVNITEIQEAFGISNTSSLRGGSTKNTSQIKPARSVIKALENLLKRLNNNFNDPWKFEIVSDPYDSTNLKIVDNNVSGVKTPVYTKFNESSHTVKDKIGIYKFPSFKVGSIVKNQTLEFKIPNAMSLTALFANNTTRGGQKYSGGLANNQMARLFEQDTKPIYDDKYLMNINKSHIQIRTIASGSEERPAIYMTPVGSERTHHNAPIIQNQTKDSFNVAASEPWFRRWDPNASEQFSTVSALKEKKVKNFYRISNGEIVEMTTHQFYEGWTLMGIESDTGKELPEGTALVPGVDYVRTENHVSYYDYNSSTKSLELKSPMRSLIRTQLGAKNPHLPVDVIIPAELGLETDGIGGILPGDVIQTDYIQSKYNAPLKEIGENGEEFGPLVYFQVFSLNQKVSPTGWSTDIVTKMRFNSFATEKELEFVKLDKPERQLVKTEQAGAGEPGVAQIPSSSITPGTLGGTPTSFQPGVCSLGPEYPNREACEEAGGIWNENPDMSAPGSDLFSPNQTTPNTGDFLSMGVTFPIQEIPKWSPKDLTPDDVMKVARNPEIDKAFADAEKEFNMPEPFKDEPLQPLFEAPPLTRKKICRQIPEDGIHIVVSGDTLSGIAKDYCIKLDKIKHFNPDLDKDFTIRIGDEIHLKEPKPVKVSIETPVKKDNGKIVVEEKRVPVNSSLLQQYITNPFDGSYDYVNSISDSIVNEGIHNIRKSGTEVDFHSDTTRTTFSGFDAETQSWFSGFDSEFKSYFSKDRESDNFNAKEEKVLKEND